MKKIWLLTILFVGSLLLTWCNNNLTQNEISENEKYVINSNCPAIVENIQILEEWDLWWFDTQWKWVPIWFWWAAFYYLPYDLEHFEEYYSLIKWEPEDKYHIWKITVSDKYMDWLPALAVLKVEKPTKAEEERERKWLDENFVSQESIFESNRFFSAYWNDPEWTLTAEPRDVEWVDKRYDVRFYEDNDLKAWTLMHLFKAWDNYRFLYDELDIRFIKWECDSWIQWDNKKAESSYKRCHKKYSFLGKRNYWKGETINIFIRELFILLRWPARF